MKNIKIFIIEKQQREKKSKTFSLDDYSQVNNVTYERYKSGLIGQMKWRNKVGGKEGRKEQGRCFKVEKNATRNGFDCDPFYLSLPPPSSILLRTQCKAIFQSIIITHRKKQDKKYKRKWLELAWFWFWFEFEFCV